VFQYGFTLVITRLISFLFSLLIIRSLPITDMGTYYYLLGITTILEIFLTWGSPVTIQTQSGKNKNSNLAFSAGILAVILGLVIFILFIISQKNHFYTASITIVCILFIISTTFSNSLTNIALAHYRSKLNVKNDIYILLAKEILKFLVILILQFFFILTFENILILISSINVLIILFVFINLKRATEKKSIELKKDLRYLTKQGFFLMLTFLVYSFPIIFTRIFGYLQFGKEAGGLLNICLLTNAGFQLYTSSWGMAIKPIIGRLNNQKDTTGIFKLWKDTNQIYTFGCIVIYTLAVVFYSPILQLLKLNSRLTYVTNVYFIILFYNLIYSLGAINNSFLQMLKLTKVEIKAMALSLLLYPIIIYYCMHKDVETLAWAVVALELFKLIVQELVLFFKSDLKFVPKLVFHTIIIMIVGIITLCYLI
jgi:O-antigen/teichoic acid export membrane protein